MRHSDVAAHICVHLHWTYQMWIQIIAKIYTKRSPVFFFSLPLAHWMKIYWLIDTFIVNAVEDAFPFVRSLAWFKCAHTAHSAIKITTVYLRNYFASFSNSKGNRSQTTLSCEIYAETFSDINIPFFSKKKIQNNILNSFKHDDGIYFGNKNHISLITQKWSCWNSKLRFNPYYLSF